ncbi:MAG: hypothetical protein F6K16_15480 [Symploca sp. SIO2B6]|nr:hypothetical protein [Symploca sp. SIO2B6]
MLNFVDCIGDWNPQLLKELKSRLKLRNILMTAAVSLVGQLWLLLSFYSELPFANTEPRSQFNRYCTGSFEGAGTYLCLGNAVNWQMWWQDLFMPFCWIIIFSLLVLGTFLIISDLYREEHRGTLNFLRLSPLSEIKIMSGKLLGVPILLYLAVILAVPLHLWAGLSAAIPLSSILLFYLIVTASCIFFYSGALLLSCCAFKWGIIEERIEFSQTKPRMPAKNSLTSEQLEKLQKALKEEENASIREKIIIFLLLNDGKTQAKIVEFLGCSLNKEGKIGVKKDHEKR